MLSGLALHWKNIILCTFVMDSQGLSAMQVDFLMSGLMVLKERIDATEALIAIDLDNRRNELVAFDLASCQA